MEKKKEGEGPKKAEETKKLDEELAKKLQELEELKKKAKQAREELAGAERRQDNAPPHDSTTGTEQPRTPGEPPNAEETETERRRLDAHARYMRYFRNVRSLIPKEKPACIQNVKFIINEGKHGFIFETH